MDEQAELEPDDSDMELDIDSDLEDEDEGDPDGDRVSHQLPVTYTCQLLSTPVNSCQPPITRLFEAQ